MICKEASYRSESVVLLSCFFFFKQKTAYEVRISDWSSDVCSSDLHRDRIETGKRFVIHDQLWIKRNRTRQRNPPRHTAGNLGQIGRASCRERVCQYV